MVIKYGHARFCAFQHYDTGIVHVENTTREGLWTWCCINVALSASLTGTQQLPTCLWCAAQIDARPRWMS